MSEGEVYCIMNPEKYAEYIRKKVAETFAKDFYENLDEFVTIGQVIKFIEERAIGKDKEGRSLLDDKAYDTLFHTIRVRIYNTGIAKLAGSGELECAWDNKRNEMIFWGPDEKKT